METHLQKYKEKKLHKIQYILFYFFIFAFLGWVLETIYGLFLLGHFTKRGFLYGIACPIYGFGVLFIILLIGNDRNDILSVFLKAILICSVLEYLTSYFMEKLFKARWWDYSDKLFNINGRICLQTMLPFGILGTLVIYIIHPLIVKFIALFNPILIMIIAIILFILYLTDMIISFNVMNKIKNQIKNQKTDNTEKIRKIVLKWIDSNSALYRHIKDAYPKFKVSKVINKIKKMV